MSHQVAVACRCWSLYSNSTPQEFLQAVHGTPSPCAFSVFWLACIKRLGTRKLRYPKQAVHLLQFPVLRGDELLQWQARALRIVSWVGPSISPCSIQTFVYSASCRHMSKYPKFCITMICCIIKTKILITEFRYWSALLESWGLERPLDCGRSNLPTSQTHPNTVVKGFGERHCESFGRGDFGTLSTICTELTWMCKAM